MTKYWCNVALFRVLLPAVFTVCTIWRPTGLSLVYFGLMLYSPMIPTPTKKTMSGLTGFYLKTCICLCFLVAVIQFTFHIVLLAMPPYGHFLQDCQFLEELLRHIGLVRLDNASVWEVCYWLIPELVSFPTTVIVYFVCRFLTQITPSDEEEDISVQRVSISSKKEDHRNAKIINFFGRIGTYVVLGSLCCVASLRPSVEGAFYFLVFLGASTWWACNKELRKGFAILCKIVMFVTVIHILALLSYQNQWPQELIPINSTWSRYFALVPIYRINCTNLTTIEYADSTDWLPYGYALRLFWLYHVLALQSRFLTRKPAKKVARLSGKLENLDTPLSRHVSIRRRTPSQRWQSARRKARVRIFPA